MNPEFPRIRRGYWLSEIGGDITCFFGVLKLDSNYVDENIRFILRV